MTAGAEPVPRVREAARRTVRGDRGVEANARWTAATAVVLVVLLFVEGLTLLSLHALLKPHVLIGVMLIPPALLKIATTGYRFARYYAGAPAYRRKGPPAPLLRLFGPFIVVLTLAVLGSGVALLFVPSERSNLVLIHKASFVLWFGVTTIHVLGHLRETASLAPRDFIRRSRGEVRGAGLRQWTIALSLVLGALLGVLTLGRVGVYLAH